MTTPASFPPLSTLRADFPQLTTHINGRPLIYLDSAATTLKPTPVIDAVTGYYRTYVSAVHRATHTLAEVTTREFEAARAEIARFIGARPKDIIFARNATEAINLVAASLGAEARVMAPSSEHHSNLLPWRSHCSFAPLPTDEHGHVDIIAAQEAIRAARPQLIACSTVSNALGIHQPVEELCAAARSNAALLLLDASQSVGHDSFDVSRLDCDFACFSGHKMLGPAGVGVLYAHPRAVPRLRPLLVGGGMIRTVHEECFEPQAFPHGFEAGTPNVEGVLGLAAACRYLAAVGVERIAAHTRALIVEARRAVQTQPGVRVLGGPQARGGILTIQTEDVPAHGVARVLADEFGIMTRAGQHCAALAHAKTGIAESLRVSVHFYNTSDELAAFTAALREILE